jgi:5-methyltetrahydrofolate--homocysteine methyltransferase
MHAGCHHHTPSWHGLHACTCMHERMGAAGVQVKEDVYEKMDKELLEFVEDVLLNRCDNATERLLEYAATLDPKSKPCAVRQKGVAAATSGGGGGGKASWRDLAVTKRIQHALVKGLDTYIVAVRACGRGHHRSVHLWPPAVDPQLRV